VHPQLSASWDLNWFGIIPQQPVPAAFANPLAGPSDFITVQFGTHFNTSAGLQLNQLLYDGRFALGVKALQALVELQRKNLLRTQTDAVAEVSKAYYNAQVAQLRVQQLAASQQQLQVALTDTRRLVEFGLAQPVEEMRLTVALNNLNSQMAQAQSLAQLGVEVLKFQVGLEPEATLVLSDTLPKPGQLPEALLQWATADTLLPTQRIEYRMLTDQYALEDFNRRRWNAQYLPRLYAVGSLRAQTFQNELTDLYDPRNRWFPNSLLGLNLAWTLYDGGAARAQAQRSEILRLKLRTQQSHLLRTFALQRSQARTLLQNALLSLRNQEQNLTLAAEVQRILNLKQQQGISANLEVVQAQTDYQQAQALYAQALLQALLAYVDWQYAHGTLYNEAEYRHFEVQQW
jgi:outer membrane protein TolC